MRLKTIQVPENYIWHIGYALYKHSEHMKNEDIFSLKEKDDLCNFKIYKRRKGMHNQAKKFSQNLMNSRCSKVKFEWPK